MDSASKALIMAGSVLIALALVGLGVFIFNKAEGIADPEQIDLLAIQQANAKLEAYAGDDIRGTQVKTFLNEVDLYNLKEKPFPHEIVPADDSEIKDDNKDEIKENYYYKITLQDKYPESKKDGYYDTYKIVKQ